MLTHLQRPLTRRYRAELLGHDLDPAPAGRGGGEGGQPHRLGGNAIFAVAFLLSAVLVGLATVALQ
ncbi:hypothetical protein ACTI_14050 [Actinoplanes sp. OR16]|uniref:hypothetical protein n=1 Tax=Actinoplanes sp. OR16 TaxID=946334 RepID=UPI000F713B31|nr:hypothetical protein [Actinoplanes sp. OR16]BBH64720.1 hypothetical protein ACTI_14050 [Actinoplanes sp. OR16]